MRHDLMARVLLTREGGAVQRCHRRRHLGSYSNAEHQWGVAMLMHALWPEALPRLALHCLSHDVAEGLVGDIPSTTFAMIPGLRDRLNKVEASRNEELGLPSQTELDRADLDKLHACDKLELYLWCIDQLRAGNRDIWVVVHNLEEAFGRTGLPAPADLLYTELSIRARESAPWQ